jgi:predicted SprT family Zn-dependent metalloprotease
MNGAELTLPPWMNDLVDRWASLWGVPGLGSKVTVEFSSRMTRSLGRCYPERRLIRLSESLIRAPRPVFLETLCHELAHVAVRELNGSRTRPHGPAWAALMREAGFKPRARLPYTCSELPSIKKEPRQRYLYVHRCPVCQVERIARRAVRRWRCRACWEAGLDGKLEIHRRPAQP